ncbi:sugar O-acetyltransferase [Traorella massiliensis]|uniref:sugar O-acetyltransferase n=1 Tax=Traorella massiliensis TaxID=1903263 RepID=UPI0008F8DD24|nr:sugar O-acetyltransferase [Traorella massiliensis]
MSEEEKMNQGEWYDANNDAVLIKKREKAMDLCFIYNQIKPSDLQQRNKILYELLGYEPQNLTLLSPFMCDYGQHIRFGKDVFVNINSYFMDGAEIVIGDHVFIGPSCGFYTAMHPLDASSRNQGLEKALPIHIEDDVWIGANVVILPGVTIGKGSVIAAGSVITHDVEAYSLAAGVPAKIMKKLL